MIFVYEYMQNERFVPNLSMNNRRTLSIDTSSQFCLQVCTKPYNALLKKRVSLIYQQFPSYYIGTYVPISFYLNVYNSFHYSICIVILISIIFLPFPYISFGYLCSIFVINRINFLKLIFRYNILLFKKIQKMEK